MVPFIITFFADMNRLQIECRECGSTYEIGSQGTRENHQGSISCFVCNNPIFVYDGYLAYYPFLKQRKEQHIKFDPNLSLTNDTSFDKESNG